MTQARREYSARRGEESYDAETVDSVGSFFCSVEGRDAPGAQKGWQAVAGPRSELDFAELPPFTKWRPQGEKLRTNF
jgi:hypothetical protein